MTPGTANVFLGATQQFTATVVNSTNTNVTWSVAGTAGVNGMISPTGLYTAPQNLPAPVTVTVTATSQADSTKTASATVTVTSDIAVSVSPAGPTVLLGAPQQFTATVTGSGNPNRNVNWTVSGSGCTGAACGSIDSAGNYTAPGILPSPPSVTIRATSQADSSKSATATANLSSGNLSVSVSGPASVDNGAMAQFNATVTPAPGSNPSTNVDWTVSGAGCTGATCGTISTSGLYTAPSLAPNPNMVTITATSSADPSRSGSTNTTINSLILVTISPTNPSVELEATREFTATVSGTTDARVVWDVNGITGGNTTVGIIQNPASGPTSPSTYTAPVNRPATEPVTVRATSVASMSDPGGVKSASAMVTFFSNIVVGVAPSSSTRAVNRRAILQNTVDNGVGGPSNKNLTWMVNGIAGGNTTVGQICVSGFEPCNPITGPTNAVSVDFLAPATVPASNPASITAVSEADPVKMGNALVTIIAELQVSVSPATSTVPPNGSQPVLATVTGTSDQRVTWAVNGIANGNASVGQICQTGLMTCTPPAGPLAGSVDYRAPSTAPMPDTVTIRATSAEDPTRFGEGTATIATGPLIQTLLPSSFTTVPSGGFTLSVTGINFVPTSPGPGSQILIGGQARSTTCTSATQCTMQLNSSDTSLAGDRLIQISNPDMKLSNQVFLRVVPVETTEDVVALTSGAPAVAGKDISVVQSPGAAGGGLALNIQAVGTFVGGSCQARGSSTRVTRPASGSTMVDICIQGDQVTSSSTYTISGPSPNDITITNVRSFGAGVAMTLTLSSTTLSGPRTIFVESTNREKSAAAGAIEVQ